MMAAHLDNAAGKWTGRVTLVLAGWIACSAWYGTLHLKQKEHTLAVVQTQVIPALKAKAGCEEWRAETNEKLALSPTIVKPSQLPKDCVKAKMVKE